MKRVLIVDDEYIISLATRAAVENAGYQVVGVAANGVAAVEQVRKYQPDVVLMDIQLGRGKMDGFSATEQIRQFSQVPVIFVSGNSDRITLSRAEGFGNVGFIVKPLTEQQLQERMNDFFSVPLAQAAA